VPSDRDDEGPEARVAPRCTWRLRVRARVHV